MPLFQWNSNLSVSVQQFDDQHKKLIQLVNDLHDAMKTGKSKEVLGATLKALIDYTASHFGNEEILMRQQSYPAYNSHKQEHDQLVKKALQLQAEFAAGKLSISIEVMNFLRDWVTNHIQGTDKKYGPFFNQKGIK